MNYSKIAMMGLVSWSGWALSGCRCSSNSEQVRPSKPAMAQVATASSSVGATTQPAPEVPLVTTPNGTIQASFVLADPPSDHTTEAYVPPSYWVHRLRGAVIVTRNGELFKLEGHRLIAQPMTGGLGWHTFPQNPALGLGALWMNVEDLAGSWPNEVWASVAGMWISDGARIYGDFDDTYHSTDGVQFGQRPKRGPMRISDTVTAWSKGRALALEDGRFRILGNGKSPVPVAAVGPSVTCPVRVNLQSFAALPGGELYGIGRGDCDDHDFLVERWTDDSVESKAVDRLPPAFSSALTEVPYAERIFDGYEPAHDRVWLTVGSATSVYALRSSWNRGPGQARLAHFDGKGWQMLPLPVDLGIADADATADGSLWLIMKGEAYVFSSAAGWRAVKLPAVPQLPKELEAGAPKAEVDLDSVLGVDAKRAYFGSKVRYSEATTDSGFLYHYEYGAILSTDPEPLQADRLPQPPQVDAGASPEGADAGAPEHRPTPFDSHCSTPFVVLFSVSDAAPASFAYPATRDALLAAPTRPVVKFVEFSLDHHRTLGASASDPEQARALVRLISDKLKGSKPTLVCFAPTAVIRELSFAP